MEDHHSAWKQLATFCFLVFLMRIRTTGERTFIIANSCAYTVWPGLLTGAGLAPLSNGGFELGSGRSTNITVEAGWSGRLWGRTGCNFSSDGVGTCATGDCDGKLSCSGAGATPPATLAEFTLQGGGRPVRQDYYDVSLVDGYNLPVTVTPVDGMNGTCGVAGCSVDINKSCPSELQVVEDGGVVSCKSACLAFQTAEYCCSGAFGSPSTCKPSSYSELFKVACPNAYSYAYDDPTSTFTCSGADYTITFCPAVASAAWTTQKKRLEILWVLCVELFGLLIVEKNLLLHKDTSKRGRISFNLEKESTIVLGGKTRCQSLLI